MSSLSPQQLIGRWHLRSWQTRVGDEVVLPLGEDPRGVLLYTPEGSIFVQIASSDRPAIEVNPLGGTPLGGDAAQRAAAYSTSLAYFGRYALHGDTVVHTIELSSFPNWTGEEQVRQVRLTDGELILSTTPIHVAIGEIVSELRWVRSTT
jgi:hypothetical protein